MNRKAQVYMQEQLEGLSRAFEQTFPNKTCILAMYISDNERQGHNNSVGYFVSTRNNFHDFPMALWNWSAGMTRHWGGHFGFGDTPPPDTHV